MPSEFGIPPIITQPMTSASNEIIEPIARPPRNCDTSPASTKSFASDEMVENKVEETTSGIATSGRQQSGAGSLKSDGGGAHSPVRNTDGGPQNDFVFSQPTKFPVR